MSAPPTDVARLLVSCPDRHGIVAAVASFLAEAGANIVASDQYSTDPEGGAFFLRMEFHLDGLETRRDDLTAGFARVAEPFEMHWRKGEQCLELLRKLPSPVAGFDICRYRNILEPWPALPQRRMSSMRLPRRTVAKSWTR